MTASADDAGLPVADDPALRFDADWFRATYPKLAVPAGRDDGPAQFDVYVANARKFALNPNPHFEEKHYRATYKDVARSVEDGTFWSGFHHYLRHGHAELRQPRRPTHRIAIDLRPFGTGRSDPFLDAHVRLLVRGLVRLIPTALFLLVVEPAGVEAFAEVANSLENTAAATHTELVAMYESVNARKLTASILVVEARMATVLSNLGGLSSNLEELFEPEAEPLDLTAGVAS